MNIFNKYNILENYMSNSYNTQDTEFFSNTKVLTDIVLQHRGKIFLLPFPILSQKKEICTI